MFWSFVRAVDYDGPEAFQERSRLTNKSAMADRHTDTGRSSHRRIKDAFEEVPMI